MEKSVTEWIIFGVIIITLLIFDLGVLNRKNKPMTFGYSLSLSLFYFTVASLFSIYIYYHLGAERTKEYFTGFLIEKAMSLDNIFVISIVFRFFAIPQSLQHRVLFWGIIGVIISRAFLIALGSTLVKEFSWILYVFAIVLIITGCKIFYVAEKEFDIKELYIYKWLQKHLNILPELHGNKFFVILNSTLYATPLFVALIIVESMDVVFAIDSIPAIFAITNDPYIVYTSNIFAILGLRALFFCLADIVKRFRYVKYAIAILLVVIGIKIILAHFIKIPTIVTLAITVGILLLGVLISIIKGKKEKSVVAYK